MSERHHLTGDNGEAQSRLCNVCMHHGVLKSEIQRNADDIAGLARRIEEQLKNTNRRVHDLEEDVDKKVSILTDKVSKKVPIAHGITVGTMILTILALLITLQVNTNSRLQDIVAKNHVAIESQILELTKIVTRTAALFAEHDVQAKNYRKLIDEMRLKGYVGPLQQAPIIPATPANP